MKPTQSSRDIVRQHLLQGTGIVGPINAAEELRRARFYIQTMEAYVASSESAEVKELAGQAHALSDDEKEEFWQWNYPIHWQDIFGVRIRSAFSTQLCSQIEATLGDIAHRVQAIERCEIKVKDLRGSTLDRHRLYLTAFANFEHPAADSWKEMGHVFRIRNLHVHQQGYAGDISNDNAFRDFLTSLPEVSTTNNFIELKAGSCIRLLDIAERFQDALVSEYDAYRRRAVAADLLSSTAKT